MTSREASNCKKYEGVGKGGRIKDTYGHSGCLEEKTHEVEFHFSVRGQSDTRGYHENNHSKLLVRVLYAESPRDEQNGYGGKSL